MSTDRSPSYLRGFILPFQQFTNANVWTAQSTFTQGSGLAGLPTSTSSPSLLLTALGDQSTDIDIKTQRGGHVIDNAGFVWKEASDSDYLGSDVPTMISNFEVVLNNGGLASIDYTSRDAIRLDSGKIVLVSEKVTVTFRSITISLINLDGSFSSTNIVSTDISTLGGQKQFPCICLLPDNSLIVAYWVTNNIDNLANIEIQRSTDDGATWTKISSRAIPTDIDTSSTFGAGAAGYDLDRLAIAANSSQILLLASLNVHNTSVSNGNVMYQYASSSEGTKFDLVAQTSESSGDGYYYADIVSYNESFIISWIYSQDSIGVTNISNAYKSIVAALASYARASVSPGVNIATVTANRLENGNYSMWIDTNARLYIMYARTAVSEILGSFQDLQGANYADYGKNWTHWGYTGSGSASRRIANLPDGKLINISGVPGIGSQDLFCQFEPDGTNNYDGSIFKLSLGGYSTVNYPALNEYPEDNNRGYSTLDWLPIDLPDQGSGLGYTKISSGSPTAVVSTKLSITCASAETLSYTKTITNKQNGLVVHCMTSNITGGSVSRGNGIRAQIQVQGSTDTVKVDVVIGSTKIYVYDVHAGHTTAIASATGLSLTVTDILMYIDNLANTVDVYYAEGTSPKKYTKLSGALTTDSNTTQAIEWGQISSSGTPRSADWHFFSYSEGTAAGSGILDQLVPKNYPAKGYYTPIDGTLKISTLDGPARENDQYSIVPRFETTIDRVLYSVSPSREITWKSTPLTTDPDANSPAQEIIAFALDSNLLGVDTQPISDSIGIHLSNINFRQFTIEKYSSSAWSTIATFNNGFNNIDINFTRSGNSIISTDPNGAWLNLNEAQGWRVILDDESGNVVVRKVATNSEGVLAATSSKKSVLQLEDAKATDPASGVGYLVPTSCTVLLHNIDSIAGLRITIPSQRTREGYFQIGQMVMGPLFVPAGQYSWGRTISFEADITEDELPNGVIKSARTGAGGRTVRIGWTDGVDISSLYEANANPDYWKASTAGSAIAAIGSAPMSVLGMLQYLDGSVEALVYLPSITHGAATTELLNRYHDHVLCTVGSDVQIEHVVGDENRATGEGEVFRVGSLTLRETR